VPARSAGTSPAAQPGSHPRHGKILSDIFLNIRLYGLRHRIFDFWQGNARNAVSGEAWGNAWSAAILLLLADLDLVLELSRFNFRRFRGRRRWLELGGRSFQYLKDYDTAEQSDDGGMNENADRERPSRGCRLRLVLRIGGVTHREASFRPVAS
jgi:hypothetical protein